MFIYIHFILKSQQYPFKFINSQVTALVYYFVLIAPVTNYVITKHKRSYRKEYQKK
jgi:hypothetical protein